MERWADREVRQKVRQQLRQGQDDIVGQRKHYWSSDFSDRLAPVERFLQSNRGRPWDKVYSELCKRFDRRTLKGYHLLSAHVDRHMVDGHGEGFCWAVPNRESGGAWVDRLGILRYTQRKRFGR